MKWISIMLALLIFGGAVYAQTDEVADPWPDQYYAPYLYGASAYPIAYMADTAGVKYLSLAFVLAGRGGCEAAWDGASPLDMRKPLIAEIEKIRANGGDVIVAFGGAAGDELALGCPDAASLAEQYQRVIDTYGLTRVDFDIEANEIEDTVSVERRSEAIALLQSHAAETGQSLAVMFTLPVMPTGLTASGLKLLQSAIDHGVDIDMVNIMTMNYGRSYPADEMGPRTIDAAESLYGQLATFYPEKTEAELWRMVGLTPMIGANDTMPQTFTLDDAEMIVAFAREKGIRQLAMWSVNRDRACPADAFMVSGLCSGVTQADNAYSDIFATFGSTD